MVRTPPFQGENPGSNPSGAAKIKRPPKGGRFILPAPHQFEPRFTMSKRKRAGRSLSANECRAVAAHLCDGRAKSEWDN